MRIRRLVVRTSRSRLADGSFKSNLGDLLRASVLDRCLPRNAMWLTDEAGLRLLGAFVDPARIRVLEELDEPLELAPGAEIYQLDDHATAARFIRGEHLVWRGFIPEADGRVVPANDRIAGILSYREPGNGDLSWQQSLVEGLGFEWRRQDYPEPRLQIERGFDVGLNHQVHPEWKTKHWDIACWRALAASLTPMRSVSWQQGMSDIQVYLRWLARCRVVVTTDSLGLHLASALGCHVVAITGPTESREFSYGRVRAVRPGARACAPCHAPTCGAGLSTCLDEISPRSVKLFVDDALACSTLPRVSNGSTTHA